ncbi:hypothetical protein [Hydrogenophaga sp.]|uniref:hypothetical protein n=1 Tax=Hydrogenophaga sp. TaxID=1904254 RepID=UPI003F7208AD
MAKFNLRGAFSRADSNPIDPRLVVLATQAADQAALLAVMVQAYTALEKIVTHDRDSLERAATREGLGSLMRALNGEMGRQVEGLVHGTAALQELVGADCEVP